MLHDKSKQVGLGRGTVCDAACFLIRVLRQNIATDDNQHALRPRSLLTYWQPTY